MCAARHVSMVQVCMLPLLLFNSLLASITGQPSMFSAVWKRGSPTVSVCSSKRHRLSFDFSSVTPFFNSENVIFRFKSVTETPLVKYSNAFVILMSFVLTKWFRVTFCFGSLSTSIPVRIPMLFCCAVEHGWSNCTRWQSRFRSPMHSKLKACSPKPVMLVSDFCCLEQ